MCLRLLLTYRYIAEVILELQTCLTTCIPTPDTIETRCYYQKQLGTKLKDPSLPCHVLSLPYHVKSLIGKLGILIKIRSC